MTLKMTLVAASTALLLACGPEYEMAELQNPADVEATQSALTNSPVTAGLSHVVRVGGCTGTLISPHFIVTAAHCFDTTGDKFVTVRGGQNQETLLYNATASVAVHPNWVDQAADRESWDVAVVHLRGTGLGNLGKANIFAGPETPWKTNKASLAIEGYGFGSDAGGVKDCSDTLPSSLGTKRRANFAFRGTGRSENGVQMSAQIYHSQRTTCQGDSGAPYFIERNGQSFIAAVHSRSERVANGTARGTLLAPKLDWIRAFAQLMNQPLSCSNVRDHRATYVEYFDCRETPIVRPPVLSNAVLSTGVTAQINSNP